MEFSVIEIYIIRKSVRINTSRRFVLTRVIQCHADFSEDPNAIHVSKELKFEIQILQTHLDNYKNLNTKRVEKKRKLEGEVELNLDTKPQVQIVQKDHK